MSDSARRVVECGTHGTKSPAYVCSLLLAAGLNVKVVSERLGHSSAAMTLDVYGHVLPGQQEAATKTLGRLIFGS